MVGTEGNDGNFAFSPAAVHVDAGATLLFEWTGEGGVHNVVNQDGAFDSREPVASAGVNFETAIDEDGIYQYICESATNTGSCSKISCPQYVHSVTIGGSRVPRRTAFRRIISMREADKNCLVHLYPYY